ncbi:unnamed protein product [Mytilus coruscus]|uniref:Uncharacterized protein n=1 Tax=Mytilus coruscus TaxID=42192 RepID=A0A6J8DQ42_MYTCO|nr:unnamed protein product [Mytilus coruscus]
MTNEQSDSILNMPLYTLEQATSVLEQVREFLNDGAVTCALNKPRYKTKPKLNVWSPDIKLALDEMRKYYAQLRTRKKLRRQVRIENAKVKDSEKQRIMETRTKDAKLFHHLVKSNRKTRGNATMDLHVGDILIETIVNVRINPAVLVTQNVPQRGFTAGSGPANAVLPVGEIYREAKDNKQDGFHGENGLDMETIIHLYKIYIVPVLLYGMDLLTPRSLNLEKLKKFQKKMFMQLMSLPTNTPDPAINILTGILPVEVMTFFKNVCTQPNESLEKQLARRQLCINSMNSNSWFIEVKTIMLKYDLGNTIDWLDIQIEKEELLSKTRKGINAYWIERITSLSKLYTGLLYLNSDIFMPWKIHPILRIKHQFQRDSKRVPTKIKLLTGTYILQPLRYKI